MHLLVPKIMSRTRYHVLSQCWCRKLFDALTRSCSLWSLQRQIPSFSLLRQTIARSHERTMPEICRLPQGVRGRRLCSNSRFGLAICSLECGDLCPRSLRAFLDCVCCRLHRADQLEAKLTEFRLNRYGRRHSFKEFDVVPKHPFTRVLVTAQELPQCLCSGPIVAQGCLLQLFQTLA